MKKQREGGFLISKIHQLSQRVFNKILKEEDLNSFNSSQGRIIYVLLRDDNVPIHDLVDRTQLTKSTLSSHLDNLENSGYIKRVPSKKDKRVILIKTTEKIKKIEESYGQASKMMAEIFYSGFDENEIDIFESFLNRCLDNLKKFN